MHSEYASCPGCTHQARHHDLEGCTVWGCPCLLDQVAASEGVIQAGVMYP